jgi:hypothetical protein
MCQPPNPIAETLSPVLPRVRYNISEFDVLSDICSPCFAAIAFVLTVLDDRADHLASCEKEPRTFGSPIFTLGHRGLVARSLSDSIAIWLLLAPHLIVLPCGFVTQKS